MPTCPYAELLNKLSCDMYCLSVSTIFWGKYYSNITHKMPFIGFYHLPKFWRNKPKATIKVTLTSHQLNVSKKVYFDSLWSLEKYVMFNTLVAGDICYFVLVTLFWQLNLIYCFKQTWIFLSFVYLENFSYLILIKEIIWCCAQGNNIQSQ